MKKSEILLLSMVAIAGVYALIDFSLRTVTTPPPPSDITTADSSGNTSMALIRQEFEQLSQQDHQAITSLSEEIVKPWQPDVFQHESKDLSREGTTTQPKPEEASDKLLKRLKQEAAQITYSGFLTMGQAKIAIVNGSDYRKNESVNGFYIADITENTIQLTKDGMEFTVKAQREETSGKFSNTQ